MDIGAYVYSKTRALWSLLWTATRLMGPNFDVFPQYLNKYMASDMERGRRPHFFYVFLAIVYLQGH